MRVLNIDELDEDGILKDGDRARVPLMMMDHGVAIDPAEWKAYFDSKNANAVVDAAAHQSRSGVYTADQQLARDEQQDAYDRRISNAWRDAPYPHLTTLGAEERQMVASMAGRPPGENLAKLTRQSAEEMHALANRAEERAKVAQNEVIKKMSEEQAVKFRRRALQLEAEAIELETPVIKKDAAVLPTPPTFDAAHGQQSRSGTFTADQLAAKEVAQTAYDKRISGAWREQPAPVVADGSRASVAGKHSLVPDHSKLGAFMDATVAGDPPSLVQARARADEKLRNAWRNPV